MIRKAKQRFSLVGNLVLYVVAPGVVAASVLGQSSALDTSPPDARVDRLLAKLSLEEKVDLISGVDKMNVRALPSIGLPELRMSDGPMGVREWGAAPSYPGGIALAASWDPKLANELGAAMGRDARARGVSFLLAPGVNIYRAPMAGRTFEYFGEDPELDSSIAVGFINGVQRQGVIATIKHFAANNQEFNRVEVSSDVDERTFRELYLPVFEAAIKQAKVGAIMDGYNPVNGVHPTQNPELNCKLLKQELDFRGVIMSDWGAIHDTVAAANACTDLEMPGGEFWTREKLLPAIHNGKVSIAAIDDKVRSILRQAVVFGFFDRPQLDLKQSLYSASNRQIALEGALKGAVLLKNDGATLPLDAGKIKTVAVIGPNATPAVYSGGGSSKVTSYDSVSVLAGLMDYLGGRAKVDYDRGLPDLAELGKATKFNFDGKPGVQMEVFADPGFHGKPTKTLVVPTIDTASLAKVLKPDGTLPDDAKAFRFTATFDLKGAGNYLFVTGGGNMQAYASGQDQCWLFENGEQIVSTAPFEQQTPLATYRDLPGNPSIQIRFDYVPKGNRAFPRLVIGRTSDTVSERARQLAASADAVVLAVGFDADSEREGMDRSFALPFGQEELIRTIAAINHRTIVVLNGGGAIDMHSWAAAPSAILHQWYPGQEGGRALAQLLFGEHNPEGKLPITFDRTWEDSPVHNSYYASARKVSAHSEEETFPYGMAGENRIGKVDRGVAYTEGLLNGYRYYSGSSIKPMYPFGFGISYTTFVFSNLRVGKFGTDGIDISANVTNSGSRAGAEVLQLYLGLPSSHVPMPARELKGFSKVELKPGETSHVLLHVDPRALSYFDVASKSWKLDTGEVKVYVGNSSSNTPLTAIFTVSE